MKIDRHGRPKLYQYDRVHLEATRKIFQAIKDNSRDDSVDHAAGDYVVAGIDVVMRKHGFQNDDQDEAAA